MSKTPFTETVINELYTPMLRFATNQLGDEQYACDVVQDTMINALKYADSFQGKSALKSWVFAILKNKISDFIRQNQKYVALSDLGDDDGDDDDFLDKLFDESGHWQQDGVIGAFDDKWGDPTCSAEQDDFWQILSLCLDNLPKEQARAFLMKEYIELDTGEICQELGISSQNFYVLMHRARLRLQTCLSIKWLNA
ncbi:sigma-70 family RNA polymerase sigma factor [Moraxella marmotae]|uniref:sigma-70 family RNA polymerase sigma factor n=1 Tax=Moraxella marmotae TaxID=3344520 RepID=UPI0035F2A149